MKIRSACTEDEKQIIHLLKQFPSEGLGYEWGNGGETFHSILENDELGSVFVATEEGRILGVITLSYPTAIRCQGRYACIEEFIVDEKGRGKGIGGQLIQKAIEKAKTKGCYELQVNRPSESGYPVYMRYGWKDLGKHLNLVFGKNT